MPTDSTDRTDQHDPTGDADVAVLVVTVTRTGGIAGMRREWTVESGGDEATRWRELLDRCPWDDLDAAEPPRSADRFTWAIVVRGGPERRVQLSDEAMRGPWRDLTDAVRETARASRRRSNVSAPEQRS